MQYHPWNDLGPAVVLATFTDWAGRYTINDADGGYLRVTPAGRSSEWARLAGPITEGISSWDASLVLRYNAGLISLTDLQWIAGDVDLSGAVNAYDAALILRKAVGHNVGHLGWQRDWTFLPSTREYFDLQSDLTGQDYTGILLGDVSGDWTPDVFVIEPVDPILEPVPYFVQSASISSLRVASTAVVLDGRATLPDSRGKVGLSMNGGAGDVYSLDAVVSFDPTQLRLTKSDLESNLTSGMVLLNEIGPGRVKVVIASTQPIPRGETLVTLRPQLISGAGDATLTLERVELNEGNVASHPVSAIIERMQVVEDSGDIAFGKDREGRHFAGNTPMKYRGAEVRQNLFGVWSVVGAEKVRGRNVSYVKRGDEVEPSHVWRMSEDWDFGGIESLGNASSEPLAARGGDSTNAGPSSGFSGEDIESGGAVTLRQDIDGRLFANDVAVLFAGGALMQPFEGSFRPIAAEVVGGENQILFQNDEGVIRRTIHRSDWAFVAVEGLEPEGIVVSTQQEPEQLRLQRSRMLAFAEQDFGVELTGDGVVGLPLPPAAP